MGGNLIEFEIKFGRYGRYFKSKLSIAVADTWHLVLLISVFSPVDLHL